jgi:hypothetical protein
LHTRRLSMVTQSAGRRIRQIHPCATLPASFCLCTYEIEAKERTVFRLRRFAQA